MASTTFTSGSGRTRRGLALLVVSAVAFSSAGFFTRQAPVDLYAMVFWRNLSGSAALLVALAARPGGIGGPAWRFGWGGSSVVVLSSGSMVLYLAAFASTSVANISIIYATAPIATAAGAWLMLREPMARRTLGAAGLALVGVVVTMGGSVGGDLRGDALALAMTLCLSAVAVIARAVAVPPLETALASSTTAALAVLAFGLTEHVSLAVSPAHLTWLVAFGVVAMAVALPCYLAGAAAVPAGRAMLISTLELPLAPLWVWLAFDERPSAASILGGCLVLAALLLELGGREWRADTAALANGMRTS